MRYLPIFILLTLSMVFISCSTSENVYRDSESVSNSETDFSKYRNLSDYLRRLPGVKIDGVGDDIDIQIRGVSSFGAELQPLFVVDGVVMGHSYGVVNGMINMINVNSIRVLSGSEASDFGMRGANGVIVITMKTD